MARLNSSNSSNALRPVDIPKVVVPEREKVELNLDPTECVACAGDLKPRSRSKISWYDDGYGAMCPSCIRFFGGGPFGSIGVTNYSVTHAQERIRAFQNNPNDWGMLLIGPQSFVDESNLEVTVELGDIVKIIAPSTLRPGPCCNERTMATFMLTSQIGPVHLRLYPHEVSPIPWLTIMKLRDEGQIEEAYVSTNDEVGHWRPTAEYRTMINNVFGTR